MATEKRLIDANRLARKVNKLDVFYFTGETDIQVHDCQMVELGEVLAEIDEAPTVDAVEVVHGKWIAVPSSDMMTGKAYKCSECGKMRYGSWMPNYCQSCGAKMDGGADDGL